MSVEVIAEVASNHGGSVALAMEFIDAFAPYVDTVKFQLTRVKHLWLTDPQYEWFAKAELTFDQFAELQALCHKRGVNFLLTCYNAADIWEVAELGCNRVKIGSGEAHDEPLARAAREAGLSAIVSCGLSSLNKVAWNGKNPKYLGCITRYPAPSGVAAAMMLTNSYDGWSDHAVGTGELEAAAVCGAKILETHVFLQNQARPIRAFEKSEHEMKHLKTFLADNPARFLGRWQL